MALQITYNLLNLSQRVSQVGGTTTDYLYSADKTKLASRNAAGCGYDYLGSLVYKTDGGGRKLESAAFDGGRIKRLNSPESGKSDLPFYNFADHLGRHARRLAYGNVLPLLDTAPHMPGPT